jgi:hypothetical protein
MITRYVLQRFAKLSSLQPSLNPAEIIPGYFAPMPPPYAHVQSTRRPIVFVAFGLSCAMLIAAVSHNVSAMYYVPVVIGGAMAAAAIVVNRQSGGRLEGETLVLFSGEWRAIIVLSEVTAFRLVEWSDGAPDFYLQRANLPDFKVPAYCLGSAERLAAALSARGIQRLSA